MIQSGLCSVTFREFSMPEVVAVTAQAGLRGIEWGGDVHVPHGDLRRAKDTKKQCDDAGISVTSCGSYCELDDQTPLEALIETAVELGAPVIRVWAGSTGSAAADEAHRAQIADAARKLAELGQPQNVGVAFELHQETLTDTAESTCCLLDQVGHENVSTYYQQMMGLSDADNLAAVAMLKPRVSHIHLSYYASREQCDLSEGHALWPAVFTSLAGERYALLEFVKGGSVDQLLADAQTLNAWLKNVAEGEN